MCGASTTFCILHDQSGYGELGGCVGEVRLRVCSEREGDNLDFCLKAMAGSLALVVLFVAFT